MSSPRATRGRADRRALRMLGVLAIAIAPLIATIPARAEPTAEDRAAATALFDEGRKLADQKKYSEACPKFEAAMRLDPGAGTLFNLSDCYEQIGRTASAWTGFREVASMAKADNRPEREKVARDRAAALEPKLAKMRILAPPDAAPASMTITRDGSALPSALVGSPVPVDPGAHTIRVTMEGKEPWETKINVPAQGGVLDVQVPSLLPKKDVTPAPTGSVTAGLGGAGTGAPVPTTTAAPTSAAPDWVNPRPWQKPLGIAATVVGVLGLGAGVGIGLFAKSTYDSANKTDCDADGFCNPAGIKTRADAVDQGNIGTVVGIAGSVIGLGGLALWIFSPSEPPPSSGSGKAAPASPAGLSSVRVAAGANGLSVSGKF